MAYYVYAPATGKSWTKTNGDYCYRTGIHPGTCGFSSDPTISLPFDLGDVTSTTMRLWASSNILSIQTTQMNGCVCTSDAYPSIDNAVRVDLYRDYNGNLWIGAILYAHLTSRCTNGIRNYPTYSGLTLGILAGACGDVCQPPPNNVQCSCCYGGIHCHMATEQGRINPITGCDVSFGAGATWIYEFSAI